MTEFRPAYLTSDLQQKILPLKERSRVKNTWLKQRLDEVIKPLMQREKIDLWIISAREYNEDPVIMSLLPEPSMAARRRTILIFRLDEDGSLERMSLDRYGFGEYFKAGWDPDKEAQFACLGRLVREMDPKSIGLNFSQTTAFGDGITHSEYEQIIAALGPELTGRVRSAEKLAIGWLEKRTLEELTVYPGITAIGHAIIREAFSDRVIQPGVTSTEDVVWWMRQKMLELGLQAWFQPTVDLQGFNEPFPAYFDKNPRKPRTLILPGDMLHCDVGFYYLGLATDQQQLAYVLKAGESNAPRGLRNGLAEANHLQDIHVEALQIGKTGNQVLAETLENARKEGIKAMIYTHPLGVYGHSAGPTIGLWDKQDGVPGDGDHEIHDQTCYAIELNAQKPLPEWNNQNVIFALEEDMALIQDQKRWLDGRQTDFHLIG